MKLKSTWEQITDETCRLKVPGGWIVKTFQKEYYSGVAVALHQVFVPDPDHDWELETEEEDED